LGKKKKLVETPGRLISEKIPKKDRTKKKTPAKMLRRKHGKRWCLGDPKRKTPPRGNPS